MAEKDKKSKQELVKENSHFLRGTLAEELADDSDKFTGDGTSLLKFHGTYQQDDRDARKQRQAGAGKSNRSYIFMVRTKVPGGKVTADQFLTELDLCDRYGNGSLRLTTRQGFQLHGAIKKDLHATIREINDSLLTTLAACGDVERNVMCCPAPHHNDRMHDRLQATADSIAQHLAPQTPAYFELWLNGEKVINSRPDRTLNPSMARRTSRESSKSASVYQKTTALTCTRRTSACWPLSSRASLSVTTASSAVGWE